MVQLHHCGELVQKVHGLLLLLLLLVQRRRLHRKSRQWIWVCERLFWVLLLLGHMHSYWGDSLH
jgi:hypothetical protein